MWLIVTLVVTLVSYIILQYLKLDRYWKNKEISYVKPIPIFGNSLGTVIGQQSFYGFILSLYNAFPKERYCGVHHFTQPVLLLRDPELIKKITIKDFDNFPDHVVVFNSEVDPLWGKNLFASVGNRWRDLRQTLSPVFTSSKMRIMFTLMDQCGHKLVKFLNDKKEDVIEFDMRDLFSRFTVEVISSIAFGVECDVLNKPNNEFLVLGRKLTEFSGLNKIKLFLYGINPKILKFFNIKVVPDDVGSFFLTVIREALETREKFKIVRPDLIHLLMEARKGRLFKDEEDMPEAGFAAAKESKIGKTEKQEITDEDITAQALNFFFGGFDTTALTMCFIAYELCCNPDVQDKLRQEILKTQKETDGNLTYEALLKMKYLDMVVSEILRKWPQGLFVDRIAKQSFTIDPENPGEKSLILEAGSVCWIPIIGLHMDPQYFENPDKFDPERFSDENKSKINPAVYLPFGSGPRNCIGSRFALLENKLLFYYILSSFEIVKTDKTRIPLELSRNHMNLTAEHGFWFGLKKFKK